MANWRPRILTLLARHGVDKYADALAEVQSLFQRQMPEATHSVLVIDNTLPLSHHEQLEPNVRIIGSSNIAWEFSAWDSGIRFMWHRLGEYDLVNFATSAFRQLYVRYLESFDLNMLSLLRGRAAAIGHIDYYNEPVSLLHYGSQAWLRSSFIILPANEIKLLRNVVSVTDRSRFFSGDPAAPFRADAPVSAGYRRNILGWLTGEGTGQGTAWHSRFDLNEETLPFFESKTLAIFNEQMLSNRLRAQGSALVDATWLATRALVHGDKPIDRIPNWRHQITARDESSAPLSLLQV